MGQQVLDRPAIKNGYFCEASLVQASDLLQQPGAFSGQAGHQDTPAPGLVLQVLSLSPGSQIVGVASVMPGTPLHPLADRRITPGEVPSAVQVRVRQAG